jgi:hypothetical protein
MSKNIETDLMNLFKKSAKCMCEEVNQLVEDYHNVEKLDIKDIEILKKLSEITEFIGHGGLAFTSGASVCQKFIDVLKQEKE